MKKSLKNNYRRAAIKRLDYFLQHNGVYPFAKGLKLIQKIKLFAERKNIKPPPSKNSVQWLIDLYLSGLDSDCSQSVPKSLKKERRQRRLTYSKYLQSAAWQTFREKALDFYGNECGACGSKHNLHVHHKHYRNIFNEQLSDVMVLCRHCHEKEHNRKFNREYA